MTNCAASFPPKKYQPVPSLIAEGIEVSAKITIDGRVAGDQSPLECGNRLGKNVNAHFTTKDLTKSFRVFRDSRDRRNNFINAPIAHLIRICKWHFGLLFKRRRAAIPELTCAEHCVEQGGRIANSTPGIYAFRKRLAIGKRSFRVVA